MNIEQKIKDAQTRLKLSKEELSAYWGVSIHTLLKWQHGARSPSQSAIRLIELLQMMEMLSPEMHRNYLNKFKVDTCETK